VRFVQLYINAQIWDNHTSLANDLKVACDRTDQPIAGLLSDLRQRGLMDSTLVIWGGEFGRLPIAQLPKDKNEKNAGRDHNKNAFCTWFAGAVENKVSVPDWHATILHLLGLSHEDLFFEQHGLKERLTGVNPARVVKEILA
jgi:arylsulfatase A-like enzyme